MKFGKGALIVLSLFSFLFILSSCETNQESCIHDWPDDFIVQKEATCTISGLRTKECNKCHEKINEVIFAAHHFEEADEVYYIDSEHPTVYVHTCSECGYEELELTGGNDSHQVVTTEKNIPTCQKTGLSSSVICSHCNIVIKPVVELAVIEHEYKLFSKIESTCLQAGLEEYTCVHCNDLINVTIKPLGHSYIVDEKVEPTCQLPGKTEGKHCDRCGYVLIPQEEIKKIDHIYADGEIIENSTCYKQGTQIIKCTMCTHESTKQLEKAEHTKESVESSSPTCTEYGYTSYTKCSVCKEVLEAPEISAQPLGHDYQADTVELINATCTESGSIDGYCNRCQNNQLTIIDKLGHELDNTGRCTRCYEYWYSVGLQYELSSNGTYYIVTGIDKLDDEVILSIPGQYNGLPVKSIKSEAFKNADYQTLILSEGIVSIGWNAFENNVLLTEVFIPSSLEEIDNAAFINCDQLENIYFVGESSLQTIGAVAFSGTALKEFKVPASVLSIGNNALYGCLSLNNIEVNINNQMYQSIDGHLYSKDGKTLIQYAIGSEEKEFTISSKVEKICEFAFAESENLEKVIIPQTVKVVEFYAFYNSPQLSLELAVSETPAEWNEHFANNIGNIIYK